MNKRLVFVLMFIFAITNTAFAEEITFEIYSVSDLHGRVLRADADPGVAQLATFLKSTIGTNKERTLLLSGGDLSINTLEGLLTKGAVVFDALNAMGFNASAIGNHDFYWGLSTLKAQTKMAEFPMLAANIHSADKKHKISYIKPYTILKKSGVKIGIIGLATLESTKFLPKDVVDNLTFLPPAPIVQGIVDQLRKDGVTTIIILSHLGSGQDEAGNIYGDTADLANTVQGIDAIISAHNHQPVAGSVNNVAIVQAAYINQAIGKITLVYDTKSKKIIRHNSEVLTITADQYAADPEVTAIVEKYQKKILPQITQPLGTLFTTLDYSPEQISPLGAWICDVLRNQTQAEIAFYNSSNITATLTSGKITYEKLFTSIPYDNLVCTIEMTGEEIIRALELGLFNDNNLGVLQFSGLKVLTDNTKWRGNRVLEVTLLDGSPLEMQRLYRVATIDFLARGGDDLRVFTDSVSLEILPKTTFDIVVDELHKNSNISFSMDDRLVDIND